MIHRSTAGKLLAFAAALSAAAGVLAAAAAPASAATAPLVCGLSQRAGQVSSGGVGILSRANAFHTDGQLCIRPAPGGKPGFTVVDNLPYDGPEDWQAYPFTGWGCAYDLCTPGAHPIRLSKLPRSASTSYSWRPNGAGGIYNAAFDDWIDRTGQTSTEDNGAELMIWLRTMPGYCFKAGYHDCGQVLVKIGHRRYWFGSGRSCDKVRICWNYLQFRTTTTVRGVKDLWLRPFLKFLEARRLVRPRWFLTSIHAGFELVSGGKGLQVSWMNAHV